MSNFIAKHLKGDISVWQVFFGLLMVSVVTVYSASSVRAYEKEEVDLTLSITKHILFLLIGTLVAYVISNKMKPGFFYHLTPILFFTACLSVMLLPAFGTAVNNEIRWYKIGSLTFQPSEFAKFALVLYLARIMAMHRNNPQKAFWWSMAGVAVISAPILMVNMSSAALLIATALIIMFVSGIKLKYLAKTVIAGLAIVSVILWVIPDDYNFRRVKTWRARVERFGEKLCFWQSSDEKVDFFDQANLANLAVSHTNLIVGAGPGNSTMKNILPEAFSDFIFAIIVEEYGEVGAMFLLGLYLWLLWRCFLIGSRCKSPFQQTCVVGMGILIFLQAIVHMMVGSGLLPVTGQTLPMISMGGTSNLIIGMMFGIILQMSDPVSANNAPQRRNKNDDVVMTMEQTEE